MTKMTSVLDTQEISTNQTVDEVKVTTVITQTTGDQVMADIKPLQILEVQVPSSSNHTIDLTNSDKEEEEFSPVLITEEACDHLQDFLDLLNSKSKKNSIPVPEIPRPSSESEYSTTSLILSSI